MSAAEAAAGNRTAQEATPPEQAGPAFATLLEELHRLSDLGKAAGLLSWDREVNMPPGGTRDRIHQMTTLSKLLFELRTSDEMGQQLERAEEEQAGADPDSFVGALLRIARRDFDDAGRLNVDFVTRSSRISGEAHQAWVEARENQDFAAFQPHLEQVVDLGREMAELYGHDGVAYDALLDRYERGTTTAEVARLFAETKAIIVPLRQAIEDSGVEIDDSILYRTYDVERQKQYVRHIAEAAGYDFDRGHVGTAVHPFASSFGQGDCRITTRYYPEFINPAVFGTLHECGHAMYEMGTDPAFARTPLARGTSSGIHESQSRMIENGVGRSLAFWQAHYPHLQATFSEALGDVSVTDFHRAINKVQASLIRVEADELTYNLHIILRFEIEQALISGDLQVADLPTAWNDKMRELLGIVPPNDAEGVLQDVHWTGPSFGYFPTYALGNLYAAQLLEAARAQSPAVGEDLARGSTAGLLTWLGENVHRHGRVHLPAELCRRATGRPLDVGAFDRYVNDKFGAFYGLRRAEGVLEV
jgi:carboxypeptidase Taq